jgi:hypothetical protein
VSNQASIEKIEHFKKEVAFLKGKKINQTKIGEAMPGVGKANFSKYINGKLPVTEEFLAKFHEVWGKDLQPGREPKNTYYYPDKGNKEPVVEPEQLYPIKDTIVEKLVEGQNRLINNNVILTESNNKLVETNRQLVALLIQQGIKPDGQLGDE